MGTLVKEDWLGTCSGVVTLWIFGFDEFFAPANTSLARVKEV